MGARKQGLDRLAICCMLLCAMTWGLGQVAAKVATAELPPLLQGGLRSCASALLVGLWARARGIPLFDRDGSLPGGLSAGALFAVEFACIYVGLQYTAASRMIVFIYLAPFVVALGMPFLADDERLSRLQAIGLVIAFGGVAWAFAEGFTRPAAGPRQFFGDALGVAAAVLWGATTLVIRGTRLTRAPAEKTLFYQLSVSGVTLLAAALCWQESVPQHLSPLVTSALLFQIVCVSFASYLLWFWLINHYPATHLASFTLLTPLFGLVSGVLLLGEPATPRLLIALGAVGAGIVLVNRGSRVAEAPDL
jgi:drug/metabolite transporter (DMT)-like permease